MKETEDLYLLLGGNLGDRLSNLERAREFINEKIGEILKKSSIYQTSAWGNENQPDFLNQALLVRTELLPGEVLEEIHKIEKLLERKRFEKWGSRTIDIDILFFGNNVVNLENLVIPHPEIEKRNFTLVPLAEISPSFIHPVFRESVLDLLNKTPDKLKVKKISDTLITSKQTPNS